MVASSRLGTGAPFPPSSGSVMEGWGVSGAAGYLGISSAQLWVPGTCPQWVESGVDRAVGSAPCDEQLLLPGQHLSGSGTRGYGHCASGDRGALVCGSAESSCWTNRFHTCPPWSAPLHSGNRTVRSGGSLQRQLSGSPRAPTCPRGRPAAGSLLAAEGGRSPWARMAGPSGDLAELCARGVVDLATPPLQRRTRDVL